MPTSEFLVLILLLSGATGQATLESAFADYFKFFNVKFSTIITCSSWDSFPIIKVFSANGFRCNTIVHNSSYEQIIRALENPYYATAVVVDTRCIDEDQLDLIASKGFFLRHHRWIFVANESYEHREMVEAAEWSAPPKLEVNKYLTDETSTMIHKDFVLRASDVINGKLIADLKILENEKINIPATPRLSLQKLVKIKALADSEVLLAIPSSNGSVFNLYDMYRPTRHAKLSMAKAGSLKSNGEIDLIFKEPNAVVRRNNFGGAVMLGTYSFLKYVYVSRDGELTSQIYDVWAQMGLEATKLHEEKLNYRMLLKIFDDYGWAKNNGFTGSVRWLCLQRAEMSADGFLHHKVRMPAVEYVHPMYDIKIGIMFRVPALSQVSNIFSLPFSTGVWLCLLGLVILSAIIINYMLRAVKEPITYADVVTFVAAGALQQGSDFYPTTPSVRFTMLVFLVSTLFLFTSYSANIVALLQMPSDKIHNVLDLAQSSLAVATQGVPYLLNLMREETDPAMRELLTKKIAPDGDIIPMNETTGVEKVREGLFAYQVELPAAYKLIGETFTEREKCGLKHFRTYKGGINSAFVPKRSPHSEHLKQRFCYIREAGFLYRSFKRWNYVEPKCLQDGAGYAEVGLAEVSPVFIMFIYGVVASVVVFIVEIFINYKRDCTIKLRKKFNRVKRT